MHLKKSSLEVLCKSCRSGSVFAREKRFIRGRFFRTRGTGPSLYTDKHCRIRKTNMATVLEVSKRFYFSVFPSQEFSKMVTVHRLDQGKHSNFQALLEVSYWQEMSLSMDDLCTSNSPVFNASRSLTGFKIAAGILATPAGDFSPKK